MSRPRQKFPSTSVYQPPPVEPIYATDINPFTAQFGGYQSEPSYGLQGPRGHHYGSQPSTPTNFRFPLNDPNSLSPQSHTYNYPPTPSSTMHVRQSSSNEYMDGGTWNSSPPPFHLHGAGSYNEIPNGVPNGEIREYTPRPRSISPKKSPKEAKEDPKNSPPPHKRSNRSINNTYDYLQHQCKLEGCAAALIVDDSRFWVCKHQLSHASEFFRTLFLNNRALPMQGVQQTSFNEYTVAVSGLRHPPQSTQFKWFIECAVPCPALKDITEESLETCMRLSRRFVAKGLEIRCVKFIQENVENKAPMVALCWLNWALKHRFELVIARLQVYFNQSIKWTIFMSMLRNVLDVDDIENREKFEYKLAHASSSSVANAAFVIPAVNSKGKVSAIINPITNVNMDLYHLMIVQKIANVKPVFTKTIIVEFNSICLMKPVISHPLQPHLIEKSKIQNLVNLDI
uniref:BTB domain-containing protein n=1 Tax=Acrobeloides nanus TaxID=290746 RepID=A0A914D1R1_9BILA